MSVQAVRKLINFNGRTKEVIGTIVRTATREDKIACGVDVDESYLVVDFTGNNVEYRGLWRQANCDLLP